MPGVTMQGLPGAPVTDENGVYSTEVDFNSTLTITPVKLGYTFEPRQITYEKVKENKTEGNFIASLLDLHDLRFRGDAWRHHAGPAGQRR